MGRQRQNVESFWQRFERDPSGCWNWTGHLNYKGYGILQWTEGDPPARVRKRAHRVAWELFRGPVAEHMQIDHLCRNRRCVNPDHLEPVTLAENQRRGFGVRGIAERRWAACPSHVCRDCGARYGEASTAAQPGEV